MHNPSLCHLTVRSRILALNLQFLNFVLVFVRLCSANSLGRLRITSHHWDAFGAEPVLPFSLLSFKYL